MQINYKPELLALDRASVRTVDTFGKLHVAMSNISKAAVNPYIGREIPCWQELGLDPDRVYMLYRDADELSRAASTFNNLPILSKHVPVSAEKPSQELVVGSTGTDACFEAPYLQNSLVVWEAIAIAGINTEVQKELSSAYAYEADMTPGEYQGQPYDGVMRNIVGNHVALVEIGRAGPDVVVGDTNPFITMEFSNMKASRKAIAVKAALGAFLHPQLAQDAAIVDLGALVRGVKAATIAQDKARIVKEVKAKIPGIDEAALAQTIQIAADGEPDGPEDGAKKPAMDEDDQREDESDEDYKKRMEAKKVAEDEDDEDDDKKKKDDKPAMDAASVKALLAKNTAETVARMSAIRTAEKEVAPFIGEVVALDSAEAVYKLALDATNIDLTGVDPSAYKHLVKMLPKPGDKKEPKPMGMDSAATADFNKRFPTAKAPIRG